MAIQGANKLGKYVGICGQGPSDHPDLAEWLMDEGIQTISLNPDTVVDTWLKLAAHKKARDTAPAWHVAIEPARRKTGRFCFGFRRRGASRLDRVGAT
jgi:phosphoenolpyruvate-protein kinase (PTS system EI component)